ncbi:DUF2303 family protein [Escherichia coli]|uniref:DUF2303 family protein n=1 Tax=Escherichia coli TaxID=562 RepID=UPI00385A7C06
MSQNLDATAINQIHALISAQGVNEIISKIGADAVALPENFRIHDLEKLNLNRFRFRGALSTASIDDFTRYSKDLADEGTRCFIDADNMRAVSVLNLGTIDEPGHADNTATLKLKKTAPFSALLSVNGERNSQKSLAEWMPVAFEFKCVPFEGLKERPFKLRLSIITGDRPVLVLRIIQLEAVQEEMANEFRDLLVEKFKDSKVETFIGTFTA